MDTKNRILPMVCCSIYGEWASLTEQIKRATELGCDLIEWRIDYKNISLEEIRNISKLIKKQCKKPLIHTYRSEDQGGFSNKNIYEDVIRETADCIGEIIDIELFNGESNKAKELVSFAKAKGKRVIGSHHEFNKRYTKEEVIELLNKMKEYRPDIIKVAIMTGDREALKELMEGAISFKRENSDYPLIVIGMGNEGQISRLGYKGYRPYITYGSLEENLGYGQIPIEELLSRICDYYKHGV